jgi:ankyrin repeat protein
VHEDEASVDAPLLAADLHPEIVTLLLERGAKEPPLAQAAEAHAINAVVRALASHAKVDPSDASPLAAAVSSTRGTNETRLLVVEKLLDAGADPNREVGTLPLYAAVQACEDRHEESEDTYDCMPLVKLLLKHRGRTTGDALSAAMNYDEARRSALLDALLAAPIEPGATASALASTWNLTPRSVKRIAAKGVDWAWHDGEDDAALPLLSAVQRADRDGVRTLLEAGAPANARFKDGTCALGVAIDGDADGGSPAHARIVELLLAHGVDVNRRLPDGRTPLFAAAEAGDLRVVTALLERGARVNDFVLDDTALDAAEQRDHVPAARLLHSRGARRARDRAN